MWVSLEHAGRRLRVATAPGARGCWVAVPGGALFVPADDAPASAAGPGPAAAARDARAPMTGRVIEVAAVAGAQVAAGATLVVLEAMKMEYRVVAPRPLVVARVACSVGDQVELGALLVAYAPAAPAPGSTKPSPPGVTTS